MRKTEGAKDIDLVKKQKDEQRIKLSKNDVNFFHREMRQLKTFFGK